MSTPVYQVFDLKWGNFVAPSLNNELQRNWGERAWSMANKRGNQDRGRQHLNFKIARGRIIQPIDKSRSVQMRMQEIADKYGCHLTPHKRNAVMWMLSGNRELMRTLAFGDQTVIYGGGWNKENESLERKPEIERWAMDVYDFLARKYGEDKIAYFAVHLDETTPHCHVVTVPINEKGIVSFKDVICGGDKNKEALSDSVTVLHDEFAEVNEKWGMERGTHGSTVNKRIVGEEWNRSLERQGRMLERKVKALQTMLNNLEDEQKRLTYSITELERRHSSAEVDDKIYAARRTELETRLAEVKQKIAFKTSVLNEAYEELRQVREDIKNEKAALELVRQEAEEFMKENGSAVGDIAKSNMLGVLIHQCRMVMQQLSPEAAAEVRAKQEGGLMEALMDDYDGVVEVAKFGMAGMIGKALEVAESHGGGGGGSDSRLRWDREPDEDEWMWRQRCIRNAVSLMKPRGRKGKGARR